MNQPIEPRIVCALVLQPMTLATISACLSIEKMTARHRVSYLREAGDITLYDVERRVEGRPRARYTLSQKGESWARELMA